MCNRLIINIHSSLSLSFRRQNNPLNVTFLEQTLVWSVSRPKPLKAARFGESKSNPETVNDGMQLTEP